MLKLWIVPAIGIAVFAGYVQRQRVEAASTPVKTVTVEKYMVKGVVCIKVFDSADPALNGKWQPLRISQSGVKPNFLPVTKTTRHNTTATR